VIPSKAMVILTMITAPAHDALRYEKVFYDGKLATMNRFRGDPRPVSLSPSHPQQFEPFLTKIDILFFI
jgi:hypothetical protein